jgi:hypothetical protein
LQFCLIYALLSSMVFIEHNLKYPPLTWGANIQVEKKGGDLLVSADPIFSDEQLAAARDVFGAYRSAIRRFGGAKRHGKNSPHIEFANATTDQSLAKFVRRFGPVVVSSLRYEDQPVYPTDPDDLRTSRTVMFAQQDLIELRDEQQLYRTALTLVAELERSTQPDMNAIKNCISTIANRVCS